MSITCLFLVYTYECLSLFFYFAKKEIAEAWNLDRLQPMVIRLNLSLSQYLDSPSKCLSYKKMAVDVHVYRQMHSPLFDFWPLLSASSVDKF